MLSNKEDNIDNHEEEEFLLKMKNSGFRRKCPQFKRTQPEKPKRRELEFNCNDCDFQGTTEIELDKHILLKHRIDGRNMDVKLKCRNCGEQFTAKWDLMNHRKTMHSSTVAVCRNYSVGKCNFSAEICWWNHINPCNKFKQGNCMFSEETCWYKHQIECVDPENQANKTNNGEEEVEESESVFRGAKSWNLH